MKYLDLFGKRVLVAGMAKSGQAAIELLLEKGAMVTAADLNSDANPKREGVAFVSQQVGAFNGFDLIVLSPGVPVDAQEVEEARIAGTTVTGELELASWFLKGPSIGITGSNGKTTTTALTGHILRECGIDSQVGGNIGLPPSAMIHSSKDERWNVLELSSFQLETIEHFRAKVGVCINVTPDHLDRHKTYENYANAKARLFETQASSDFAILNADNETCVSYASRTKAAKIWFSTNRRLETGLWIEDGNIVMDGKLLMPVSDVPLPGRHNLENVMSAAAAATVAGATLEQIAAAVKTFKGVAHRLEFIRELNGVRYYNDSKATNVDATEKALESFPGNLWVILGGKDKGSDYTTLAPLLKQKAKGLLLIGKAATIIENQLGKYGLPLKHMETLDRAVAAAHDMATAGDIVLLAPACASFDQFKSYEHRGQFFRELVMGLEQ